MSVLLPVAAGAHFMRKRREKAGLKIRRIDHD